MFHSMIAPLGTEIDFHNRLIAIVDDDEIFRSYISILLTQTGARIRTLACSDELLELIEREMPSCIILDNNLLSENGIYVFKRLRARYPNLAPVIMLSADETQTTAVKAFRNGFDDYLQKRNLRPEDIEQAIQRALAHHETSRCVEPPRAREPSPPGIDPILGLIPSEQIGDIFSQVEEIADRAACDVGTLAIRLVQWEQILFRFGKKPAADAMTSFTRKLKATLQPNEICGRLSDDILFCILVTHVNAAHLRQRVEELQSALTFDEPIYSVSYHVTPEILGTVRTPGDKDLANVFQGLYRKLAPAARNDDSKHSGPKTFVNASPAGQDRRSAGNAPRRQA